MKKTYRTVLWMIIGCLIVAATYLLFDATHSFYKVSLIGDRYFREGNYFRALPYLLDAYRMHPQDKNIAWKLVWTYQRLNRRGEGRRIIEEINNRFPVDPKVSESLGDMAYSEDAYVVAQRYYERVLARKPSVEVRRKYVKTLLAEKLYADALGQMDILLSSTPDDKELRYQHAQIVSALGDHERAVRELQSLFDDGYANKEALTMLGDEYRHLGKDQEAIKIYQEVANEE